MRDSQIPIRCIIITDEGKPIRADRHRTVLTNIVLALNGRQRGRGAGTVSAVNHPEVAVRRIVVADQCLAVGSQHHRRGRADINSCSVQRGKGRVRAPHVATMSNLQIAVGDVVVTDEGQTICPDGNGRVGADVAGTVQCGERG